jgi:sigma-B regulation protein RsbU (phosphoserine phosphatase)
MEPEQVITFLNRYLGKMIEVLVEHRAVIDEIIGDGILAFFGAPTPQENHPRQAVACALKMQLALEDINRQNEAEGFLRLEMGIAVNTGKVVVGNIGSELRTKYSVVGSPVNFTGRMESFSVGGQVLISESTWRQVRNEVLVGDILEVQMKGVPGTARLYEVRGLRNEEEILLRDRCETLQTLSVPLKIQLSRLREKIVIGEVAEAHITHICETAAVVAFQGELEEWEDVRVHLAAAEGEPEPGKIYGKVSAITRNGGASGEAQVRFTSVSPGAYRFICAKGFGT